MFSADILLPDAMSYTAFKSKFKSAADGKEKSPGSIIFVNSIIGVYKLITSVMKTSNSEVGGIPNDVFLLPFACIEKETGRCTAV